MNAPTVIVKRRRAQNPLPPGLQDDARELIPASHALQEFDEESEEMQSPEDRVIELLQGASGDARAQVKIYRNGPKGNEYCGTYSAVDFEERNLDLIRENFGSGEYSIMLYGSLPSNPNRVGLRTRTMVRIAESRAAAPVIPGASNDMAAVLRVITDGQRQMQESIVAMQNNRPDPMAQFGVMLTLATQMREAFGLNSQPIAQQKSSIAEVVDAIRELRDVSKELDPDKAEKPDTTRELIDLAKPIVNMVASKMQQQTVAQGDNRAIPSVTVPESMRLPNPAPAGAQATEEMDSEMLAIIKLKMQLNALVTMAETNADPKSGAELIYEKLPDDLVDMLELPVWWEMLIKAAPQVEPHREWLTKARDLAMAMFAEPEPDAPEESPVA